MSMFDHKKYLIVTIATSADLLKNKQNIYSIKILLFQGLTLSDLQDRSLIDSVVYSHADVPIVLHSFNSNVWQCFMHVS